MWSKKRQSVGFTPRKLRMLPQIKTRIPMASASSIKVVVRVRPPNERDLANRQVLRVLDETTLLFDPQDEENSFFVGGHKQLNRDMLRKRHKNKEFEFDLVFEESATNEEVFKGTTNNFISSLLDGYNCSVFVYGATGAGKTYTMLGSKGTPGIAYLTMVELFKEIGDAEKDYDFEIKISYLEVYNEMVKDLICPSGPLSLRDDGRDGIIVAGIKMHQIKSADDLFNMLEHGNRNRTQHPTDSNAESSRSHAVFQVHLRITHKLTVQTKVAKLAMIDLAGSERGAATGGKGARFAEGSNINKSLLALGNCVDALAEGHKHIPYRNSKLTRILKDSLGGNCKTIMVVNVSPTDASYEETLNTLQYASRAKKINIVAKKKILNVNMPISQYKKIIEDLKMKIEEVEEENRKLKKSNVVVLDVVPVKSEDDLAQARDILKHLYGLQGKYAKELLIYKMKICTVAWRIKQKQMISRRLNFTQLYQGDSQARVDQSITQLKSQMKCYQSKARDIQKLIKEKQTYRDIAVEGIRQKGLYEDLQNEINFYSKQLEQENCIAHLKFVQDLNIMQEKEIYGHEKIITKVCKSLGEYYTLLLGYGKATDKMKEEYMQLMQQLGGVKGVSWGDEPDEFATLRKVIDLKYSPQSLADDEQPPEEYPGISLDISVSPIAPVQIGVQTTENSLAPGDTLPLGPTNFDLGCSPHPGRGVQDLLSPISSPDGLNRTCTLNMEQSPVAGSSDNQGEVNTTITITSPLASNAEETEDPTPTAPASPSLRFCQKMDLNGTFVVKVPSGNGRNCLNQTFVSSPKAGPSERKNSDSITRIPGSAMRRTHSPKVSSAPWPTGLVRTLSADKPLYVRMSPLYSKKSPGHLNRLASTRPQVLAEVPDKNNKINPPSARGLTKDASTSKHKHIMLSVSQNDRGSSAKENKSVIKPQSSAKGRLTYVKASATLQPPAVTVQGIKKMTKPWPSLPLKPGSLPNRLEKTATRNVLPR